MSELTRKELVDQVENHIIEADLILQALIDVAEMGRKEMEAGVYDHGDRFVIIRELLGRYREGNSNFIKILYQTKAA